jgi:hypothetical protein
MIDTMTLLAPSENEAVTVVDACEMAFVILDKSVDEKISRDAYPFSICVDGMASR